MLNRNKARNFGKEYATVHAADITSVLKPSNSEPNMRRSSPQSDLHLNNLAEKIPIHYRSSKKPMVPAPACAHDLSCTDFEDEESTRGSKSQIARMSPKGAKASNFLPGDRVIFAESPSAPGIPVVYRTPEERASNLDRLNLDRRKLTVCPILEGEEQLRLLNYQHNMISKIQHLSVLKRLIFLDLYDNHIEEISGLSSLKSLRVLMLGKNRIKQIENLEALTKLDVLDLHGNQISRIENLSHLSELRVLNLAGNQIVHVDNLSGMDALAELNLRRNRIRTVVDVDSLPNLQRLFLSFNDIAVFDDISCLSESSSLSEISLDGNPIAQDQYYKQIILRHMQQLRQLDMKRVSEEERRIALVMSRKEDEKRREMNKLAIMKEKRRIAINNAKRQWEVMQGSLFSRTSKLVKTSAMPELYASHVGTFSNQDLMGHLGYDRDSQYEREDSDTVTSEKRGSRPESAYSVSTDLSQEMVRDQHRPSSKTKEDSRPPALKETMIFGSVRKEEPGQGSDVSNLAELDGDTLSLYGPQSLEAFDKPWGMQAAGAVGTIVFKFIDFEEICKYLHKIRTRFPSTQTLVFSATNIHSLQQINALSSVRRLDNLTIDLDGNPVTKFTLWRMYTVFRLAHFSLKKINDVEVSASDIVNAEKLFGPLSHVTTSQLPKSRLLSLLGETRRKQLLAFNEEKARKTGDTKQAEKAQAELVGRAGLTYLSPDSRLLKQQDADAKRAFAKSVLCELIKEAVFSDRKRAELQRLWPQIFHDMIQQCLSEMNSQQANVKQCLCEMEKV